MSSVRVVIACRQRLMRDIVVAAIGQQASVEIVGEVNEGHLLFLAIEENMPDVVILALGDPSRRPAMVSEVLQRYPAVKVIALSPDRNQALFYWISPAIQSRQIECCEQGLTEALLSCTVADEPVGLPRTSQAEKA
jgi:AmiR/NasT family two-component response regulator